MRARLVFVAMCALIASGCAQQLRRTVVEPGELVTIDSKAPFIKVHMRDGSLYVLSPWSVDEAGTLVWGAGKHYSVDRRVAETGDYSVSVDSVALFETNVARTSPSVAGLSIITGLSISLTIYCVTVPKACFGSCPTFYFSDGDCDALQAEGFSASITPSLEARDVDALYRTRVHGREVRAQMVNEAYETHVVRRANLLAAPRAQGHRVFHDDAGGFWSASEPVPPSSCRAREGDCADALASFDGRERWSGADSTDLAARETIDLVFDDAPDTPALVVASRQTLLPTYILYQAFAYLGTSVGDWMAKLESGDAGAAQAANALTKTLGGIDVLVANHDGEWNRVTTIAETGPLAADVRIVPLPAARGPMTVRLEMARGAWRIDSVGLASMDGRVEALRIEPSEVLDDGRPAPEARALLVDPDDALVTFPGDRYTLVYRLPGDADNYELFLESQGYYLEWMRDEWMAEENSTAVAAMFMDPAGFLRRLAPAFKRVEADLDAGFWRSKYAGF